MQNSVGWGYQHLKPPRVNQWRAGQWGDLEVKEGHRSTVNRRECARDLRGKKRRERERESQGTGVVPAAVSHMVGPPDTPKQPSDSLKKKPHVR